MNRILVGLILLFLTSLAGAEPTAGLLWVEVRCASDSEDFAFRLSYEDHSRAATLVDPKGLVVIPTYFLYSPYLRHQVYVTSPQTGKVYEAKIVATDYTLGLAFLQILDWHEEMPAIQLSDRKPDAGEKVSVLSRLDEAEGFAPVRAYAHVAGSIGHRYSQSLLDRSLPSYVGLPVLDENSEVVGLVGQRKDELTRLISAERLAVALDKLSK
jgi:hypothetical protein